MRLLLLFSKCDSMDDADDVEYEDDDDDDDDNDDGVENSCDCGVFAIVGCVELSPILGCLDGFSA